jgi:hypothetical protein
MTIDTSTEQGHGSTSMSARMLTPGQRITISGNAPNHVYAGEWIALESEAFVSKLRTNGTPTIRTQVMVDGTYTVAATIKPGLKPTSYAILGLHNDQPLDTTSWITVRPYSSVAASPRIATAGQRIKIKGKAPRKVHAGEWITLKSHAFSSRFTTDGIPSVRAQILVNGTYEVTVPLRRTLAPTSYTVRGTYKGQPLDTVGRITVR